MRFQTITIGDALARTDGRETDVGAKTTARFHGRHPRDWVEVRIREDGIMEISASGPLRLAPVVSNNVTVDLADSHEDRFGATPKD